MIKEAIKVNKENGLESKQAALFIQKASNYKSNVWIEKMKERLMEKAYWVFYHWLFLKCNNITIIIEGEDEEDALNDLKDFLTSDLEESV